jgi:hypothetical protein
MAYKNVLRCMRQLQSLNLIELIGEPSIKDKLKESLHNPKYYRLTTGGIFNLIYRISRDKTSALYRDPTIGTIRMFQNYSDNILFRTILSPYFETKTLSKIENPAIFVELLDYLNKCCVHAENFIQYTKENKGSWVDSLFNWDFPEKYDIEAMDIMNDEFDLGFTEKPIIEKIESEEMIKIFSKKKSVFIKLNYKKDAAILTTDDGKIYELGVELSDGKYIVGVRMGTHQEVAFSQLMHGINYSLLTLAVSMIMRITEKDFTALTEVNIPSFRLLSMDRKLMPLLERTKKMFEERYQALIQLKNET